MQKKTTSFILTILMSTSLLIGGCARHNYGDSKDPYHRPHYGKIKVPQGTEAVAFFGDFGNSGVQFVSPEGQPFITCNLCTDALEHRYGKHCENAPKEANICGGLIRSTLRDFQNFSRFRTTSSPECLFFYPGANEMHGWPPGCTTSQ